MTAQVDGHRAMALREVLELRREVSAVAEDAVDQHDRRRPRALLLAGQDDPIALEVCHRRHDARRVDLDARPGGSDPSGVGSSSRMVNRVDAVAAKAMIDGGVQLVDVLPASVYKEEHLPGARSVPLDTLAPSDVEPFDKQAPLLVYCFDQH